jgi:hypothetical protein
VFCFAIFVGFELVVMKVVGGESARAHGGLIDHRARG